MCSLPVKVIQRRPSCYVHVFVCSLKEKICNPQAGWRLMLIPGIRVMLMILYSEESWADHPICN